MTLKRFDSKALRVINIGVRIFGVLVCFVGVGCLLRAWLTQSDRIMYEVLGLVSTATGVAIWIALPISQPQIDSLRERSGHDAGS
jgi:hypothetical protein